MWSLLQVSINQDWIPAPDLPPLNISISVGFNSHCPSLSSLSDGCMGCSNTMRYLHHLPSSIQGFVRKIGRKILQPLVLCCRPTPQKELSLLPCSSSVCQSLWWEKSSSSSDHSRLWGGKHWSASSEEYKGSAAVSTALCKAKECDDRRVARSRRAARNDSEG